MLVSSNITSPFLDSRCRRRHLAVMARIVTYASRPKRPPRKRAKAPLIGSAIVRPGKGKAGNDNKTPAPAAPPPPPGKAKAASNDNPRTSAIVSGRTFKQVQTERQ